jgi:hypothetical protein
MPPIVSNFTIDSYPNRGEKTQYSVEVIASSECEALAMDMKQFRKFVLENKTPHGIR